MDSIKLWISSFSGALLISSLFKILVSNSSLKNVINIFLSVLIFLHTLLPVEKINTDFSEYFTEEIKYEQENYLQESYEQIITKSIENICKKNNISLLSVEIDSYIDEDKNCCIKEIRVYINSSDSADKIKELIYDELGIEVVIC